jgi:hypothetical protein
MTDNTTYLVPASFAQQRMWVLEQLEDGAPTYNSQLGLRFSGALDRQAVVTAVQELVRRHEALRSTFDAAGDGALFQVIGTGVPADLVSYNDLSGRPDPAHELDAAIAAELRLPFDLATGPVLRAGLYRLGDAEHVLLLTLDHVTCDGWSMGILHRDLVELYRAAALGTAAPAEPAVQYADYAVWQRDWLRGVELERQLAYWRRTLADPPPMITFPASGGGGRESGTTVQPLPDELVAGLRALGRRHRTSLFTVVTAAFAALFARYTGRTDLILGTVVANRTQAEVADVVGLFANTVALRLDVSGDPAVPELIARTRNAVLDAQTNQNVPFDQVVSALNPGLPTGRAPYFNVIVEHTDIERAAATAGAVRIDPMPLATLPIPVDLVVNLRQDAGRLAAIWHHDSAELTAGTVATMREHLTALLTAMVAGAPLPAIAPGPAGPAPVTSELDPRPDGQPDPELLATVSGAWQEVLGTGAVGQGDNFFELGGHSLAATRVVARLRRSLPVDVRTRLLFEYPVLADFCAAIGRVTPS